ncbi:MAG: adenylyl-sulfate reductase subunit alpha [Deltaproteobacteria bacterium]|nr:adenylyl-sulfate reductase subunit alpha [Deltaproteobacteria bacterium]
MTSDPSTFTPAVEDIEAGLLIIGGGAAGSFAAAHARSLDPSLDVVVVEKANIIRSGCLCAGISSINAYVNKGETPESFTRWVANDNFGVIREDLVLSLAKRLDEAVKKVESWGLPILKEPDGSYTPRGRGSIKIRGERIKPIMARAVAQSGARVINRVAATNFWMAGGRVAGVLGFNVRTGAFVRIRAPHTIIATGGCGGLYLPTNTGLARHKVWYSPFNTGAGLAMGLRAGAEMTSFEMRFIALRVRDFMSPTGVLAQGFKCKQVNRLGENYLEKYYSGWGGQKMSTAHRLLATLMEDRAGRGPCYLDTSHLTEADMVKIKTSYLDMSPSILLMWGDKRIDPKLNPVRICGSEPYVQGGHGMSGYWIGTDRRTTIPGLHAIGDVAGGAPKKYASGGWAEAMIAVDDILSRPDTGNSGKADRDELEENARREQERVYKPFVRREKYRGPVSGYVLPEEVELRLQKLMDEYAGGISKEYELRADRLDIARHALRKLEGVVDRMAAPQMHDLMLAHEVIDRILVARALVEHLDCRKETRWPCYQTRTDYPERDDANWLKFVNTVYDTKSNEVRAVTRPLESGRP